MGDHNAVLVRAPAKVNLSLDITGILDNGYHQLDTVMQAVSLWETLTITRENTRKIRINCVAPLVPQDSANIAHKAAVAFFDETGIAVDGLLIDIEKRVPAQAGLGGGSADAAGVLCGLNEMYGTKLSLKQLQKISSSVGADVPFCVQGGCAHASGYGEILLPMASLSGCWLVLAKPQQGVCTAEAFDRYDHYEGLLEQHSTKKLVKAVADGDLRQVGAGMYNVFEQVLDLAEVAQIKEIMLAQGALGAVLSGSGSAVVGLFTSAQEGQQCMAQLAPLTEERFLVRPVESGPQVWVNTRHTDTYTAREFFQIESQQGFYS